MPTNGGFTAEQPDARRGSVARRDAKNADFGNFRSHMPKPPDDDNPESARDVEASQLRRCFRRFTSIMLSHLGTLAIVIAYVIMGGFLFSYLESGNEISSCSTAQDKYQARLAQAAELVYIKAQGSNATEAQKGVLETMQEFASDVYALNTDPSFNCSSYKDGSTLPNWNVVNAAYFCVTIVSTIGYGHICPMTQWGQIVCIVYGILGIPLMLLFLSKIGEPTAVMFRTFYLNFVCCKCFIKKFPNENIEVKEQEEPDESNLEEGNGEKHPPAKVIDVIEDADEDMEPDNEEVNIPIIVTIMLLMIYVLIGASVFRLWEKWTMVEGAYFSFITLTTIGFGDYVPGRNGPFNSSLVIAELLVGCIYCLFGLALLSMCINLIQDEISAKFRWIGSKLRIAAPANTGNEDEDDEDDEDDDDDEDDEGEDEETDEDEEVASRQRRFAESRA